MLDSAEPWTLVQRGVEPQQSRSSTDSGITPIRHTQNAVPAAGVMVFTAPENHDHPFPGKYADLPGSTAQRSGPARQPAPYFPRHRARAGAVFGQCPTMSRFVE